MERNQNNDSNIPQNNSSKAMDSKREVEQSNDAKTDQDFPGYPHYPAKEDAMGQRTDLHLKDKNAEDRSNSFNATGVGQRFTGEQENKKTEKNLQEEQDDELAVFNSRDEEIGIPQNVSGEDMNKNLPGSNLEKDADENR